MKIKCCLCEKWIDEERSHNAQPLEKGRCCLGCNTYRVVPYRKYLANNEQFDKMCNDTEVGE